MWVNICACICVRVSACIYVWVHKYVCMYVCAICLCVCACVHMDMSRPTCAFAWEWVRVSMCMRVGMHKCVFFKIMCHYNCALSHIFDCYKEIYLRATSSYFVAISYSTIGSGPSCRGANLSSKVLCLSSRFLASLARHRRPDMVELVPKISCSSSTVSGRYEDTSTVGDF